MILIIKKMAISANKENKRLCDKIIDLENDHDKLIDDYQADRKSLCNQIKQQSDARKRAVQRIKILEKALELACKSVEYANYCKIDDNSITYLDFKKEFIEKANEELKDEI